ncbi:MAG: mechanosensitive ion channel family protein [Pikeienuella sp.]
MRTFFNALRAFAVVFLVSLLLAPSGFAQETTQPESSQAESGASAADYGALASGTTTTEAPAPNYGAVSGSQDGPDLAAYAQVAEIFQEPTALEMTQQQLGVFRQKLRRIVGAVPNYFSLINDALDRQSPTGDSSYFLGVFIFVVLLIAIGRAVTMIFALFIALPVMRGVQKPNPHGIVDKLPVLATRVLMQFAGIIIALTVAALVGSGFYQEDEATLKTVLSIAILFAVIQVVDVSWRMVLSPFLPDYRIPDISDRDARRLYRWASLGAFVSIVTLGFTNWLKEMKVDEEVIVITMITVTFISVMLFFLAMRSCSAAVTKAILGGKERGAATWLAATASIFWRPALILYLGFAWFEMSFRLIMGLELGVPLLAGLVMTILASLIVYSVTAYLIERLFSRSRRIRAMNLEAERADLAEEVNFDEMTPDQIAIREALSDVDEEGGAGPVAMAYTPPVTRPGMRTFEDLANRVASLFAVGAAAWALVTIWGGDDAFAEGSFFDIAQDLIDVAFVGYIAFHAARIWMDQKIAEEGGPEAAPEPGDEGGAGAAASRLGTLLPLFRTFVLLVIAVTAVLLFFMELGVNVAPLFAGAGVVGLAIGFGAQSLVRDILSGIFFLSDDAFRKGEYIDVGEVKGTVEKISLRSFQLRHHLGALNTIPFGEIKHLTNYSRDWVMMKLPLRLTYDTDVDKVRKLVKKLGVRLLDHETEGHKFVQPLKSQGVYMMEDSAMIIRVKFMTRPGDQWTTRKLVYSEIRKLFEENGIKFAHKEVTVRIPEMQNRDPSALNDDDKRAIGAAARRAVEEEGALAGPPSGDTR